MSRLNAKDRAEKQREARKRRANQTPVFRKGAGGGQGNRFKKASTKPKKGSTKVENNIKYIYNGTKWVVQTARNDSRNDLKEFQKAARNAPLKYQPGSNPLQKAARNTPPKAPVRPPAASKPSNNANSSNRSSNNSNRDGNAGSRSGSKSGVKTTEAKKMAANYKAWAKANPTLAKKLKKGQAGYDTIFGGSTSGVGPVKDSTKYASDVSASRRRSNNQPANAGAGNRVLRKATSKPKAKEKGKPSSLKKAMQGITPKQQRKRNEGRY